MREWPHAGYWTSAAVEQALKIMDNALITRDLTRSECCHAVDP
ncbi:hypothetical protein AA0483_1713 [Acetobacter syzygii NRIC 0483]|nr:hypothetical protein AA0483_1713 [Acetobacter syzygii NRIC 0483]